MEGALNKSMNLVPKIAFQSLVVTGMGSVYTLTALSLQRCFILYYPTHFSIHGASLTKYIVALIWIIASIFAITPLFGLGSIYRPELSGLR